MPDLFLIRHLADVPADVSLLLRPVAEGAWDSCRRPQEHRKQAKHTLRYGPDGWALTDDTSRAALYRPAAGVSQDKDRPPLGPWQRVPVGKEKGEECTLTDVEPTGARISGNALQAPFADFVITDTGDVVTMEGILKKTPITEAGLEALMKEFKAMLIELVKRPRVILNLQLCMNGAPVPSMRIVKQYMNFAGENAMLVDLVVRGFSIVLKPEGYVGYALSNIVKMVIRVLPAPWELTIVPTLEEGRAWMAKVAVAESKVLARRTEPNETLQPASAAKKGSLCEEATPSTAEEGLSPLGAGSDGTPCAAAEQSPKEGSPKEQPPRERAYREQTLREPSLRELAEQADEAQEEEERLEVERPEGAPSSEPRGCWGVGWFFTCQCSRP